MSDWREVVGHDFTPEDFAKMEAEGQRIIMESRTLAEIRKMQEITQVELAERLEMTQGAIAQLEGRNDTRVSTLRAALEQMGGSLKIVAEMPGQPPVQVSGFE